MATATRGAEAVGGTSGASGAFRVISSFASLYLELEQSTKGGDAGGFHGETF